LAVIIALAIANGLFSAAEIAVLTLRKSRLAQLVDSRVHGARAVQTLRNEPERFLATVQIGINVIAAAAAASGGAAIAQRLVPIFARLGPLAPYARTLALGTVVILVSFLSLVLGELVPKSFALRHAEGYSVRVARPLLALSWLLRPAVWVLT